MDIMRTMQAQRVELYKSRVSEGKDIFSGKRLRGKALKEWEALEKKRIIYQKVMELRALRGDPATHFSAKELLQKLND